MKKTLLLALPLIAFVAGCKQQEVAVTEQPVVVTEQVSTTDAQATPAPEAAQPAENKGK